MVLNISAKQAMADDNHDKKSINQLEWNNTEIWVKNVKYIEDRLIKKRQHTHTHTHTTDISIL